MNNLNYIRKTIFQPEKKARQRSSPKAIRTVLKTKRLARQNPQGYVNLFIFAAIAFFPILLPHADIIDNSLPRLRPEEEI